MTRRDVTGPSGKIHLHHSPPQAAVNTGASPPPAFYCFSLLSPPLSGIFYPFSNMFSQKHPQLCRCAQQHSAVTLLPQDKEVRTHVRLGNCVRMAMARWCRQAPEQQRSEAEQCPCCPSRLDNAPSAFWALGRGCCCTSGRESSQAPEKRQDQLWLTDLPDYKPTVRRTRGRRLGQSWDASVTFRASLSHSLRG